MRFGLYNSEEEVEKELLQVLYDTNAPMKEYSICKSVQVRPFVEAYDEIKNDATKSKDCKILFRELRRPQMWRAILKLKNDGHSPSEAAKALKIPYSTAYYYFKKFNDRKKPRGWNKDSWKCSDVDKAQIERIKYKEPYKERKVRLASRKLLLEKAEEKRARKAERLKAIFEKDNQCI